MVLAAGRGAHAPRSRHGQPRAERWAASAPRRCAGAARGPPGAHCGAATAGSSHRRGRSAAGWRGAGLYALPGNCSAADLQQLLEFWGSSLLDSCKLDRSTVLVSGCPCARAEVASRQLIVLHTAGALAPRYRGRKQPAPSLPLAPAAGSRKGLFVRRPARLGEYRYRYVHVRFIFLQLSRVECTWQYGNSKSTASDLTF